MADYGLHITEDVKKPYNLFLVPKGLGCFQSLGLDFESRATLLQFGARTQMNVLLIEPLLSKCKPFNDSASIHLSSSSSSSFFQMSRAISYIVCTYIQYISPTAAIQLFAAGKNEYKR